MKKQVIAILAVAAMLGLTACGESEKNDNKVENAIDVTVTEDALKDEITEEAATEAVTEAATEAETEAETEAVTTEPAKEEFKCAEGLSNKYGDVENPAVAYKGNILKFGEATVQDFLDAGVELFSNDINKEKADRVEAQVKINDTLRASLTFDYGKTTKECVLTEALIEISNYSPDTVSVATNYEEDMVQFNFPLDLKIEDLLSNSGEPTEISNAAYANLMDYTFLGPSRMNPENERHCTELRFMFNTEKDLLLQYYIDINENA